MTSSDALNPYTYVVEEVRMFTTESFTTGRLAAALALVMAARSCAGLVRGD